MENNLADLLNEINLSRAYDIYIPSLKTSLKFKPLIIEQLRNAIERVAREPFHDIGFLQELNSIIKANVITDINTSQLTELDKIAIVICIRINDISPTFSNLDISFKKEYLQTSFIHPTAELITDGTITLNCEVPKLSVEESFNEYTLNLATKEADVSTLKDILDLMFIAEIAKYISSIHINEVEYHQNSNFNEWVNTISTLSVTSLIKVIPYIDNVKSVRDNMLKIDDNNSITYNIKLFTT